VNAVRPSLASAVAARLAPVVPSEVAVFEEPAGWVTAQVDGDRWVRVPIDEPNEGDFEEVVAYDPPYPAFGVLSALDAVQELARDELEVEWPPGLPEPMAEIRAGEVRFWFGEREAPALSFDPILV
jgi:hypothetical protein